MTTNLKAQLERHIFDWMEAALENEGYPSVLLHEGIVEDMASAAALVFDASVAASKCTEKNNQPA